MAEVHVVTCGVSLLTNFLGREAAKGSSILAKYPDLGDSLRDPGELEELLRGMSQEDRETLRRELLDYLKRDPRRASAEVNSLFGYVESEGESVSNIKELISEVHLIRSDTEAGKLTSDAIYEYLHSLGLDVSVHAVQGFGSGDFGSAVSNLVRKVRGIVRSSAGEVVFNLTGGYKAEIAAMAVLAAESGIKQYYVHEASRKAVILPSASELKVRTTKWEKILMVLATAMNIPLSSDPLETGFKLVLTAAIIWIAWRRA